MKQPRYMPLSVILALFLLSGCRPGNDTIVPTPLPPLEVVAPAEYIVETGTVRRTLTLNGRVTPLLSQNLFFEDDGVVTDVFFQQGDPVEAGDIIAQLGIFDLQYQLAQAELNLQAAELQINHGDIVEAEIALSHAVTEDDRRLAEARLKDAQNQEQARQIEIQLLQEDVNRLQAEIARRQVIAPFNGILFELTAAPGDEIMAFVPFGSIADPTQLEVAGEVTASTAAMLGVGQVVTVTLTTQDLSFGSAIRQLPVNFESSKDNRVHISLSETTGATIGELATIFIILEEKRNVLTLPPAAIRTFQGRTFVIVAEPDGTHRRFDIRLGLQGDTQVEIVEGVMEGQVVIGE